VQDRRPSQVYRFERAAGWSIIGHGEAIVPIFIGRGAPVRNAISTPKPADFPMQAAKSHPRIARLTNSANYDDRARIKCTVTVIP